jgi:hypothetical protein
MYAHLWHVDGEAGEVDYETILGPFDGVQLTYGDLRETESGDRIAFYNPPSGYWFVVKGDGRGFSDVTFSDERPESIVG